MLPEVVKYPFYTLFHPFEGFWDLKYDKKGRVSVALGILVALVVANILNRQFAGFVVNNNNLQRLNSIDELQYVVLPFLLWCVANRSLTTLMDGEGKFKEIVIATGYALLPLVLIILPITLISNAITIQEGAFYYFFKSFATCWFIFQLFVATMTIHQYSVAKTILTCLLTLVVMGLIIFLGLLFFSLIQQIASFFYTIYQELTFIV